MKHPVFEVRTSVPSGYLRDPILNIERKPGEYIDFHKPVDGPQDPLTLYVKAPERFPPLILRLPGVESIGPCGIETESDTPPPAYAYNPPKPKPKTPEPTPPGVKKKEDEIE